MQELGCSMWCPWTGNSPRLWRPSLPVPVRSRSSRRLPTISSIVRRLVSPSTSGTRSIPRPPISTSPVAASRSGRRRFVSSVKSVGWRGDRCRVRGRPPRFLALARVSRPFVPGASRVSRRSCSNPGGGRGAGRRGEHGKLGGVPFPRSLLPACPARSRALVLPGSRPRSHQRNAG